MWNKVKDLFANGSQALILSGYFNIGLFFVCLGLSFVDPRTIAGVNAWLKPMKFCLSVSIYCFTLGVMLGLVDGFEKMCLWVGRAVAVVMYIEQICITFQAARGVTSHYNIDSGFDGAVFAIMGICIALNTILDTVVFGLLVLVPLPTLATGVLWGIRLGLMMFIAAGFEGSLMIMHQGHTYGAPDGGPGMPWSNWSREYGDLRVAHFIGLHSLQILPMVGLLADRVLKANTLRAVAVTAAAVALSWLMWMQTQLALAGKPFFKM